MPRNVIHGNTLYSVTEKKLFCSFENSLAGFHVQKTGQNYGNIFYILSFLRFFIEKRSGLTQRQDYYARGFVHSQGKYDHVKIPNRNTKQRGATSG
jgi:hypothetical protein